MDGKKIISVIEMYQRKLSGCGVIQERMDPGRTFQSLSQDELLSHAFFLCSFAKEYAADPEKFGKANRHLTAIQMCLSFAGWYTLEDLMNHNRP